MNKVSFYNIVILFLIISSCRHSTSKSDITPAIIRHPQIIDINKGFFNRKNIPLSEIATNIEYVKLEATKNSMIKGLLDVTIASDYIFVRSIGIPYVMQFDRTGKYIRQIGSIGRGPEEYTMCTDFTVNDYTKQILIKNYANSKIMFYDFNGVYQKSIDTKGISKFVTLSTGEIVCSGSPDNWINPKNFIILSLNDKGDTLFHKKSWFYRNLKSTHFSFNQIYSVHDSVFIHEYYRDTIYLFNNRTLIPYYILLWDKFKVPDIYKMTGFGIDEIKKNSSKVFRLMQIQETQNYFYMYFQYLSNNYLGRYNKSTGEVDFYEDQSQQGCMVNDFDGGLSVNPQFDAGNNKWVAELDAYTILNTLTPEYLSKSNAKFPERKDRLKLLVNDMTENDNPVIMIISLK